MTQVLKELFKDYTPKKAPTLGDNVFPEDGVIDEDGLFSFNQLPGIIEGQQAQDEEQSKKKS